MNIVEAKLLIKTERTGKYKRIICDDGTQISKGCNKFFKNSKADHLLVARVNNEFFNSSLNFKTIQVHEYSFNFKTKNLAPKFYKLDKLITLKLGGVDKQNSLNKFSFKKSIRFLENLTQFHYTENDSNVVIDLRTTEHERLKINKINFFEVHGIRFGRKISKVFMKLCLSKQDALYWYWSSRHIEAHFVNVFVDQSLGLERLDLS